MNINNINTIKLFIFFFLFFRETDALSERPDVHSPSPFSMKQKYNSKYFDVVEERAGAFILNLFKTDIIKKQASTEGTLLYKILQDIDKYPLFLLESEHGEGLNRLNFTSWVRVLNLRNIYYENPYVSDLYLLHELKHISTMPYGYFANFDDWKGKIIMNEKLASLYVESIVYFEMPELRDLVPFSEIWVDRFLNNEKKLCQKYSNQEFFQKNRDLFIQTILDEFISIKYKNYSNLDELEKRSFDYDKLNIIWTNIWKSDYQEVEDQMQNFFSLIRQGKKEDAIQWHFNWLDSHTENYIWYKEHAIAFQEQTADFFEKKESKMSLPQLLTSHVEFLNESIPKDREFHKTLQNGYTGMVYSVAWPDTRKVILSELEKIDYNALYARSYLRRQDVMHTNFFQTFKNWASPVTSGLDSYPYCYPSNGSNEAIKDYVGYNIKTLHPGARLHVFQGEYKGVTSIATALGVEIVYHTRDKETIAHLADITRSGDFFYISQPSSIDGNVWRDYDYFLTEATRADLHDMVDLAYLGLVAKEYNIKLEHPVIDCVFFSLSKSMGIYYYRAGGIFMRSENQLLSGNIWFKNLLSLYLGTKLMERFDVYSLPRKYLFAQEIARKYVNTACGQNFQNSDVVLMINSEEEATIRDDRFKIINRGIGSNVRVCISPVIDTLINPSHSD